MKNESMEVHRKWFEKFVFGVPDSIKRILFGMGMPVAGLSFRVEDGVTVFDDFLEVTVDGRFCVFGSEVPKRVFAGYAILTSVYGRGFAENFYEELDIRRYSFSNGNSITAGWVSHYTSNYDWFVKEKELFGVRVRNGMPEKRIIPGVRVFVSDEKYSVMYRAGQYCSFLDGDIDGVIMLMCWGHPVAIVYDVDLPYYWKDLKKFVGISKKFLRGMKIYPHRGWFLCEYSSTNVDVMFVIGRRRGVKFFAFTSPDDVDSVDGLLDEDLMKSGWYVSGVFGRDEPHVFYSKNVNGIVMSYHDNRMDFTFRNGALLKNMPPGLLLEGQNLFEYFKNLVLF